MNEFGRDALEMPNQLVPQRPQLGALTSLRFFAAFHVLLFHLWGMEGLAWTPKWLQTFASAGYTGVTFFFVLSGFIFVYTYAGKPLNLREFWRARLARLYPVYLLGLLLTAPLFFSPDIVKMAPEEAWPVQHMGLTIALVLTMMQAWIPQAALGWNVVSWSVSVEIFFYSMFPWLMARLRNISNRGLVLLGGASWAVSVSLVILFVVLKPDGTSPVFFSFWRLVVGCNPLLRLPEFLFGLTCGIWFVREKHTGKWATLLTLIGVAGVLGSIAASRAIPDPILATGLMAPAYAAVICGLALRPRWIAALEMPWLVLLGEASYALYLLHGLVLIVAMFMIQPNPSGTVSPVRALMATCAAILVSVLIFRFVDTPLRRRLRGQRPTRVELVGT